MKSFSLSQKHETILAILVSVLLALILTWPVILSPVQLLVGHPGNDTWNHVWGYWWVADALGNGYWPTSADLLAYPYGGTLYFIDTMQVIFSLPVQWIGGPELAYNFIMIGQLSFCGFSAWLLSRHLTGDALSSGISLVVFGTAPHILGQAYNGISETICAGWVPFTIWALLRNMKNPSLFNTLLLGGAAGVCVLTSWYYGLFTVLASLIIVLWYAAQQAWLFDWYKLIKWNLVALCMTMVMVIGPFLSFQSSLSASDAIVTRDPLFVENSLLNHNITDLASFFNPTKVPSPDLFELYGEELIIVIYLGWVAISLSLYGIWSTRPRKQLSIWLWLGLIFFLFSLGPYLNIGGEYYLMEGKKIPLPFLPLYKALPIFDRISHPFRFVTVVSLSLSILSAYGLRSLIRGYGRKLQFSFLLLASVGVLTEVYFFSPVQIPIPCSSSTIPAAYTLMREDPQSGAVLDLPLTVPNLERAVYVWYQKEHRRPIPWGLNDPMPKVLIDNYLTMTLIRLEATHAHTLPAMLPELDLVIAAHALVRQGYRYIVVHENLYPTFKFKQVETLLTSIYGTPVRYPQEEIIVFKLSSEVVE
jgi:hypothetical protein